MLEIKAKSENFDKLVFPTVCVSGGFGQAIGVILCNCCRCLIVGSGWLVDVSHGGRGRGNVAICKKCAPKKKALRDIVVRVDVDTLGRYSLRRVPIPGVMWGRLT